MSAVDEIQAAIAQLEAWKAEPEPPFYTGQTEDMDGNYDDMVEYGMSAGIDWGRWSERNRTIDAQLAILHKFAEYRSLWMEESAMQLARAINGGTN